MLNRAQRRQIIQTLINNFDQTPAVICQQPLSLLIGKTNAGKTALMQAAGYAMIESITNNKLSITRATKDTSTWLELPDLTEQPVEIICYLLKQALVQRRMRCVDKIIIAIDVFDAIQQTPAEFVKWLKQYRQGLETLLLSLKQAPHCYLIFTHMDQIAGFSPTHTDNESPYWGYTLAMHANTASLVNQHQQCYEQLLRSLHETLIVKLENANSTILRQLIAEFPLQMESMGNMVKACVTHFNQPSCRLQGVFFTAAQQAHTCYDRIGASIANNLALPINEAVAQSSGGQAKFVGGTLACVRRQPFTSYQRKPYRFALTATTAAVAITGLGILHFQHTIYRVEDTLTALKQFHRQMNGDNLYQLLPALSKLSEAKQSIENILNVLPIGATHQLRKQVVAQYQATIHQHLLPMVQQAIEQQLIGSLSPEQTYLALKAYLMLANPTHFDADYLAHWVSTHWRLPDQQPLMAICLKTLARGQGLPLTINQQIADNARSYLNEIAPDYLFANLIFPQLTQKTTQHRTLGLNQTQVNIPERFTRTVALQLLESDIPQALAPFMKDDWVLGQPMGSIEQRVKQRFLRKYQRFWQKLCRSFQPASFDSVANGAKVTAALMSQARSESSVLSLIQTNTHPFRFASTADQTLFNKTIADNFTAIASTNLAEFRLAIQQAHSLLVNASHNGQAGKHAFSILKDHFNQPNDTQASRLNGLVDPKTFAEPVASWLDDLNNNIVLVLTEQTKAYIDHLWQREIYQAYLGKIAQRFPFAKQTSHEVTSEDFISFFNPSGQLRQFIDTYLTPFIDTSQPHWQSKIRGSISLGINEFALHELIRANIIQEMFFNGTNTYKPRVALTLHTLSISPGVESLKINLLGSTAKETQVDKQSINTVWPGRGRDQENIRLMLFSNDGQTASLQQEGFWSLLKLLKQADVTGVDNHTNQFQVAINLNDAILKFLLITEKEINPFIPGIMESFSLPRQLFDNDNAKASSFG